MTPPINIDGETVQEITIDSQPVNSVTMDGDQVFGGAIPDSGLQHDYNPESYNLTEGDTITSSWEDNIGSADGAVVGTPTYRENVFDGSNAVELDGSSDAFDTTINQSQRVVWFLVVDSDSQASRARLIANGEDDPLHWMAEDWSSDVMTLQIGDFTDSDSPQTGQQILTVDANGANSRIRRNGIDILTAGGTNGAADIRFGSREDGSEFWAGRFGRILTYNGNITSVSDVEQSLSQIYNIPLN